jgi:hypothetical protein
MTFSSIKYILSASMIAATILGCAGRPSLLPNSDKGLRKTSAQFAADAAKRQPYKSDAPRGGAIAARAQVGYSLNRLEIVNLSDTDWSDVEIWVNKKYVLFIPTMLKNKLEAIPFQMMFDDSGNSFPTDNSKIRVDTVEIFKDGKMYDVTKQLAD